jgi:hypothetical protein
MSNSKFNFSQILPGLIVGIILGGLGAYFGLYREIVSLKTKVNLVNPASSEPQIKVNVTTDNRNDQNSNNNLFKMSDSIRIPNIAPDKIIDIVKGQQAIFVKESYGENANQCFTDNDLHNFMTKSIPVLVSDNLQKNNEYLAVVIALKNMDVVERQQLLKHAQGTFKPTWGELGHISREGQTDAGQTAEKLIAKSIVELTMNLLTKSIEELKSMTK